VTTAPATTTTSSGSSGGSTTTAAPGTGAASQTPAAVGAGGTVTFAADGLDFTSVASWIQRIQAMQSLRDLWVASATRGGTTGGGRSIVTFSSNATLTPAARSDRLERFQGGS
jgi:hypothetical protein